MKKNTHPQYRQILFVDSASGHRFVCGSTLPTNATEVFEGVEYPVTYVPISSTSHPLFTGSNKMVDSEGRVEKFRKRFNKPATATIPVEPKEPVVANASVEAPVKVAAPAPKPAAKAPAKPAAKPAAKDAKKGKK
ncbi:MAG: type B 50S ribosomal protein L31 [Parachlamydiaceae bacterium]|nr:type B 50S ribosomal protein L31 [Parachlamydiaceae bacterium]